MSEETDVELRRELGASEIFAGRVTAHVYDDEPGCVHIDIPDGGVPLSETRELIDDLELALKAAEAEQMSLRSDDIADVNPGP